jgi:hypothetical protein
MDLNLTPEQRQFRDDLRARCERNGCGGVALAVVEVIMISATMRERMGRRYECVSQYISSFRRRAFPVWTL